MLARANWLLRNKVPAVHALLKRSWHQAGLPIPRLLHGKLLLLHGSLIAVEPTEPHILHWISNRLRPGDSFFDIGAHHGWMTFVGCQRVGRSGTVVAFEPSPPLYDLLLYHKAMNRLRQLEVISKAVSCSNEADASFCLVNGGQSFLNSLTLDSAHAPSESRSLIRVDTVMLDTFCRTTGYHPALVKIDVEGAELLVLQGARSLLAEVRPALILAVHPPWLPYGQKEADIFNLLASFGYRVLDSHIVRYEGADFGDYLCVAG